MKRMIKSSNIPASDNIVYANQGSADDLLNAVVDRIDELESGVGASFTPTTVVQAGEAKRRRVIRANNGSTQDLLNAVNNRIRELEVGASKITSSTEFDDWAFDFQESTSMEELKNAISYTPYIALENELAGAYYKSLKAGHDVDTCLGILIPIVESFMENYDEYAEYEDEEYDDDFIEAAKDPDKFFKCCNDIFAGFATSGEEFAENLQAQGINDPELFAELNNMTALEYLEYLGKILPPDIFADFANQLRQGLAASASVTASTGDSYFVVEEDLSYVQQSPDAAESVYKYYVKDPSGDGDGFVEVNRWGDEYEIEGAEDHYSVRDGTLWQVVQDAAGTKSVFTLDELEAVISNAFATYLNTHVYACTHIKGQVSIDDGAYDPALDDGDLALYGSNGNRVTAAVIGEDDEYLNQLGSLTCDELATQGHQAGYQIQPDGNYLYVEVLDESGVIIYTHLQPLADIIPIPEDLQGDAAQLASYIIDDMSAGDSSLEPDGGNETLADSFYSEPAIVESIVFDDGDAYL